MRAASAGARPPTPLAATPGCSSPPASPAASAAGPARRPRRGARTRPSRPSAWAPGTTTGPPALAHPVGPRGLVERPRLARLGAQQEGERDRLPDDRADDVVDPARRQVRVGRVEVV